MTSSASSSSRTLPRTPSTKATSDCSGRSPRAWRVALRNAALFDETKRLLTETDERAAELAIINGIQQGLAAELDLQAMYELVGDKIQEIFDAQVVDIGIFDHERGMTSYPYAIERGVRYPDEPTPISGLSRAIIDYG